MSNASSPKASIPNACAKCCNSPAVIVVEGERLCGAHTLAWAAQEMDADIEQRVQRAMVAIDAIASEPIGDDWDAHLRKMAVAAIEAANA